MKLTHLALGQVLVTLWFCGPASAQYQSQNQPTVGSYPTYQSMSVNPQLYQNCDGSYPSALNWAPPANPAPVTANNTQVGASAYRPTYVQQYPATRQYTGVQANHYQRTPVSDQRPVKKGGAVRKFGRFMSAVAESAATGISQSMTPQPCPMMYQSQCNPYGPTRNLLMLGK